ncbi:MAG: hypothetical protein ACI845_002246 [Gammaproteobacteria bacterium]
MTIGFYFSLNHLKSSHFFPVTLIYVSGLV